jgi:Co/Zn/Cd efflux system component
VIVDAIRRYFEGSEPIGGMMMTMAAVAAVVNLLSLYLLKRLQNKDVNLRAATTFSINDFVSNGGVLLAGIVVIWTGANWPDLLVGIGVAGIALYGGVDILRDAHQDIHEERGTEHRAKK